MKEFFKKVFNYVNNLINKLDEAGKKWIGFDGLLNMESFALITIVFMVFAPTVLSVCISLLFALAKCYYDKKSSHTKEYHDLICAAIGIIFGCIIGIAL